MALKYKYKAKEEIPAERAGDYVEREGEWVLDCEEVTEKAKADEFRAKLDEFRTNNVALLKRIDDQNKRYEGIDPEEVRKLVEEKRRLEEERQLKAGEIDKVIENRIKVLRADWENQGKGKGGRLEWRLVKSA
jgi:predicted nuclease with TOPRIM domain